MAPYAFSIRNPSAASASSTRSASRTISGPMPSPERIAIFIAAHPSRVRSAASARNRGEGWGERGASELSQPRLLGQMPSLERADLVGVPKREPDVVPAVQKALLAERIDVERERHAAVVAAHRLRGQVDRQRKPGKDRDGGEQAVD